jgi:putative ABC transport system substrate-binding protein
VTKPLAAELRLEAQPMLQRSRRRWLVASTAALLTAGRRADAQPRAKRIAFLAAGRAEGVAPYRSALMAGLRERGWIEGSNLVVDIRFAQGDADRAVRSSGELLALDPDVFLSTSDAYAVAAAKLSGRRRSCSCSASIRGRWDW